MISIASMVGLLITFGIIDYYRVTNGRKSIFAIQIVKYKNGGSIQYLGLDLTIKDVFNNYYEEADLCDAG